MSQGKGIQQQKSGLPKQGGPMLLGISQTTTRSSPFPHPDELEKYESILPGFSQTILNCYEKEVSNRQQIELLLAKSESGIAKTSMITTFGIVMSLIALCVFSLYTGHEAVANTIVAVTIVAFASVFFVKNFRDKKNSK